jgi:hypothetical protein
LEARIAHGEAVEVVITYAEAAVKQALVANGAATASAAPLATAALEGSGAAPVAAARALSAVKSVALSPTAPAFAGGGARVAAALDALPMSVVTVSSAAALAALRADPAIEAVHASGANRPQLAQSLGLISAPAAGASGFLGRGCVVAVLDGGGDYSTADLGACSAPGAATPCRVKEAVDMAGGGFTKANPHSTNGARGARVGPN